jgi:hypothetical protein
MPRIKDISWSLTVPADGVRIDDGGGGFQGIAGIGNGRVVALRLNGDIWRSDDNGKKGTWAQISSLPDQAGQRGCRSYMFAPDRTPKVFCWGYDRDLYRSLDGGETWTRVYTHHASDRFGLYSRNFAAVSATEYITPGWFHLEDRVGGPIDLRVSDGGTMPDGYHTGTNGSNILRSLDGGATWTPDPWNGDAVFAYLPWQRVVVMPDGPPANLPVVGCRTIDTTFDGTQFFVFLSYDRGRTWQRSTTFPGDYNV